MHDFLIVGGGVIGLSLAYELAGHGARVRLLDRAQPGSESSWAGAGIIPPGSRLATAPVLDRLAGLCEEMHPRWSAELRDATGADNGYRRSGGVYIASDESAAEMLTEARRAWQAHGIVHETLDGGQLIDVEPALGTAILHGRTHAAAFLPGEAQLRNPRHLKALLVACARRGVDVSPGVEAHGFVTRGRRIDAVQTNAGPIAAGAICVAGGAWSAGLLAPLGIVLDVRPVRGQMVLLSGETPLRRIVNEGKRYLVPRGDGRVLVGSTEEDAGFDKSTTVAGIGGLLELASKLAPHLATARLERCWAGLRPASADGAPYLGGLPGYDNGFVATGHFRAGLQLSPGTALLMAQLMRGVPTSLDLAPFAPDRHVAGPAAGP